MLYITQNILTLFTIFKAKHQIYSHRKNENKGLTEMGEFVLPINRLVTDFKVNRTDCLWDKKKRCGKVVRRPRKTSRVEEQGQTGSEHGLAESM